MTLHAALKQEHPLQIVGTTNAYSALLAKQTDFCAINLSGAVCTSIFFIKKEKIHDAK